MSKKANLYFGRAGHLAVMSEFLNLGWNVAIPEVDIGDDIFVIRDKDGYWRRVQVKTSNSINNKKSYSASFCLRLSQLSTPFTPELIYVFVVRKDNYWKDYIIIDRMNLNKFYLEKNIGSKTKNSLVLRFSFDNSDVKCSKENFNAYRNKWSKFKQIIH